MVRIYMEGSCEYQGLHWQQVLEVEEFTEDHG